MARGCRCRSGAGQGGAFLDLFRQPDPPEHRTYCNPCDFAPTGEGAHGAELVNAVGEWDRHGGRARAFGFCDGQTQATLGLFEIFYPDRGELRAGQGAGEAHHFAEQIGIGTFLQRRAQGHSRVGHRCTLLGSWLVGCNPNLNRETTMTTGVDK
jgi:hypothetical protein